MYKPMLGESLKIWVIINDSSSSYTYLILTLTSIQILELKSYPWIVFILDPRLTLEPDNW
jgi:hypothetical protein